MLFRSALSFVILVALRVRAYIPAQPTNDTNYGGMAGGPNITDVSQIDLQWFWEGCVLRFLSIGSSELKYLISSFSDHVSYQLVGSESDGISQVRPLRLRTLLRLLMCDP